MKRLFIQMLNLWFLSAIAISAAGSDELMLTLPPVIYAAPGQTSGFYFDNIILSETPNEFTYTVTCKIGTKEERRYIFNPGPKDAGTYPLRITVSSEGSELGRADAVVKVAGPEAGKGIQLKLLVVGDSLTGASVYPNELYKFLTTGGISVTMFGTSAAGGRLQGVQHEGYGGWTWNNFLTRIEKEAAKVYNVRTSPFIFVDENGSGEFSIEKYFEKHCGGTGPDLVTFLLGINDCFSFDPSGYDFNSRIDSVLNIAEEVITAFHEASPKTALAFCLTTAPNARQGAFQANYGDRYTRWNWKNIQHRLVISQLKKFSGREDENIFIVPTQLWIDPIDGYPENNAVHPNAAGYRQIASSIFCWTMNWLETRKK